MDKKEVSRKKDISRPESPCQETLSASDYPPTLKIDVDYYKSYLDDMDIPEEQKRELVETIFSIVLQFVDLGFGIAPVQQAMNEGQKESKTIEEGGKI